MAKKILIVDDSLSIRQLVSMTLIKEGYEVVEAENGEDALRKLESIRPNLIISDVNMPKMNGIELVKAVKKQPSHKFTPIMMLTTESQEQKKQEGREAGAKAWLVKPFSQDKLLAAVSKLA